MEPLDRFVTAQAPVYGRVLEELRRGRKVSHWMWFVFPQIRGLGKSAMAERYAIQSRAEAEAYLGHALLGTRLHECTNLVNAVVGSNLTAIFGSPDDLKFCSCMTLFAKVAGNDAVFLQALRKYCDGKFDPRTIELLGER